MSDPSLAELEGLVIDKGAYELGSLAWLSRALVSPIAQLGVPDLRLLVSHGRGLRHLMPRVLEVLERDPLAAGDRGAGELLVATCAVDPAFWAEQPALRERLARIIDAAEARAAALPAEPERAHWREELAAAREHVGLPAGRNPGAAAGG